MNVSCRRLSSLNHSHYPSRSQSRHNNLGWVCSTNCHWVSLSSLNHSRCQRRSQSRHSNLDLVCNTNCHWVSVSCRRLGSLNHSHYLSHSQSRHSSLDLVCSINCHLASRMNHNQTSVSFGHAVGRCRWSSPPGQLWHKVGSSSCNGQELAETLTSLFRLIAPQHGPHFMLTRQSWFNRLRPEKSGPDLSHTMLLKIFPCDKNLVYYI